MKAIFSNFPSFRKKLANLLSLLAPHRESLPAQARDFYDECCVYYFSLIPPIIFSDKERYDALVEIYEFYVKRRETV